MSAARHLLGLDLGGTNLKAAIVDLDESGPRVVESRSMPTMAAQGPAAVVERMVTLAREIVTSDPAIIAIGIGLPGIFDPAAGTIELFPNLPGPWQGQPMRDPIAAATGLPVTLINDARAFTLAEGTIGAAKGCRVVVGVTLGTGIGGGLLIDGKVHLGAFGRGGEIAHQVVIPDGPLCGCGNRGCVEALARASVVAERAGKTTIEEVYEAGGLGDERCQAAIEEAAGHLGLALANLVTVLGPDCIVIGGGISTGGEVVIDPIRRAIRKRVTLLPIDRVKVVAAELGPIAGAVGAALAAHTN